MIPENKAEAVTKGLRQAFGVDEFRNLRSMTKGLSSDLIFRIEVQGVPYLLRILMRMNEQIDPARWFPAMRSAAEAGIAPKVRYASEEEGIAITDFVHEKSWPVSDALIRIPRVLRTLHALPPFPKTFNYPTMHRGFIRRFRTANILPADEVEEVYRQYERLAAIYPRLDEDMVSSHCDVKPENILFDGERVWLVDWQAAFVNDRYFDLGVVANFVVNSEEDELRYLAEYFGRPANEYERARFFLMRQIQHLMYASVMLLLSAPVSFGQEPSDFQAFHRSLREGEVTLADKEQRIAYARVHWLKLLENMTLPRFEESLKIVAARHASREDAPRLLPLMDVPE